MPETRYLTEDGEPILWTTKDGRQYALEEMGETHIENCARMLNRKRISSPFPCFNGEMAQMYAESEYDHEQRALTAWIDLFHDELKRRKEEK
jgi:hypothetical protein